MHRVVHENLDAFLRFTRDNYSKPLPRYVVRELKRYIGCGLLDRGFSRLRCKSCGADMLLAFSCKARICPSCAGRRMAQSGIHLVDHVLPSAPLRQWVVSFPWQLRELLAAKADVFSSVHRIFERVVLGWYRQRGRELGCRHPETGAVSVQQRFGSSANLHCHLHAAHLDGVYERDGERLVFRFVDPPSQQDLQNVTDEVARRVTRMLARRGLIGEARHDNNEAPAVDDAMAGLRKVGLARGRFERIDDRGHSQPSLLPDDAERFSLRKPDRWAAEQGGFSVHAGVAFSALDRRGREGLLRYMLRPAIAVERVSILRDGSVAYRTKYKLRSGASARVMSPIEFLCRMAALVPPPRIPMLRYHGCLAAASPLRKLIAPAASSQSCEHRSEPKAEPACRTPPPAPEKLHPDPAEPRTARSARSSVYIPWATLLARTFGVDGLACPRCKHGRLRPIAVITKDQVVSKILAHLSLPVCPELLADECTVVYDVTGQSMPGWVVGADPEPPDQEARGPPDGWFEGIDPPCPED